MHTQTTDNYRKHTTTNPIQKFLINNFYDALLSEAERLQPNSILDVGCGEGFTLERLKERKIGKKLTGVDFLNRAIEIGKKERPHLDLRVGNIYDIPFKDNSFDLVICSEVLEHIDDPEKGLSELVRVCKQYCLLSVPNEPLFMASNFLRGKNWKRLGNDIDHIQHWSAWRFKKFVEKRLSIVTVRQPFPWTLIVSRKARVFNPDYQQR